MVLLPGLPYWKCKNDEIFDKFRVRTAFSISFGERLETYQKHVASLASAVCTSLTGVLSTPLTLRVQNPHLFHAVVTMTLVHDRYLDPESRQPGYEAYHWYRATSAFSEALTRRPRGDEPAALLMTAALLGLLSMANIEATTPEEAWPLAPPSSSDLAWLKMSEGKKEVFKVTQQTKVIPTPLWEKLSSFYRDGTIQTLLGRKLTTQEKATLPEDFSGLFNAKLSGSSAEDGDDPFQWAANRLAVVLASDSSPEIMVLGFLLLVSAMRSDFKQLLVDKEPRALVLLAWWFAKANELGFWWVSRRSLLEGQAICVYLEREYPHDRDLQKLLDFPKSVFEPQLSRSRRSSASNI